MNRRTFIADLALGLLAARVAGDCVPVHFGGSGVAPAPRVPVLYGDGRHDDTEALQALLDRRGFVRLPAGHFRVSSPLVIHGDTHVVGYGATLNYVRPVPHMLRCYVAW